MPEKLYRVTWDIDLNAESPQEAAEKALRIMQDPESIATVFSVAPWDKDRTQTLKGETVYIDVADPASDCGYYTEDK